MGLDDCMIPEERYEDTKADLAAIIGRGTDDKEEHVARCVAMEEAERAFRTALATGRRRLVLPADPDRQAIFREMVEVFIKHSDAKDSLAIVTHGGVDFLERVDTPA